MQEASIFIVCIVRKLEKTSWTYSINKCVDMLISNWSATWETEPVIMKLDCKKSAGVPDRNLPEGLRVLKAV